MSGAAEAAIGTVKRTLAIANKRGLHARAAAKFVRSRVFVRSTASWRSIPCRIAPLHSIHR